jgi:hypothetical protein
MSTETSNSGNENTATQQQAGNENTSTQTEGQTNVTMTQEDLNTLINAKFAKGAEKSKNELLSSLGIDSVDSLKELVDAKKTADEASKTELEKMTEQLDSLRADNEKLTTQQQAAQKKAAISGLAAANGVADVEYFEYEYSRAAKTEGFNADEFVNGLRDAKPYVFGQSVTPPRTDSSSNGGQQPADFSGRVKAAKTKKELDALYAEIK